MRLVFLIQRQKEGTGTGVYIIATAREVPRGQMLAAIKVFYGGRHPKVAKTKPKTVGDYSGDKPLRLYKATVSQISVLKEGERIQGYYVDRRVTVTLNGKN